MQMPYFLQSHCKVRHHLVNDVFPLVQSSCNPLVYNIHSGTMVSEIVLEYSTFSNSYKFNSISFYNDLEV